MKAIIQTTAAVTFALGAMTANCITLSVDKVQQRYPWNGIVDIDYTVAYADDEAPLDPAKDRIELSLVDESVMPPTTNSAHWLSAVPTPAGAGKHRVAWNANKDGVTLVSSRARVLLSLVHYGERYMVVDLANKDNDGKYVTTYLDAKPMDGFSSSEYKDSKIVFRLIPPGSCVVGSPATEAGRGSEPEYEVVISRPFYMSIYEVTQAQYTRIMGNNPSHNVGEHRPVDWVATQTVRGNPNTYNWATTTDVAPGSFVDKLGSCMNGYMDIPTEAQWEYACRAGTTTPFSEVPGASYDETLATLGRFTMSDKSLNTDPSGVYETGSVNVGQYKPNAWGLYDMHGNVREMVRGWACDDYGALQQLVDPIGASTGVGGYMLARGGSYAVQSSDCRAASKTRRWDYANEDLGIRLICEPGM